MKLRNKKTGEIIETYSVFENGQNKIVIRKKDSVSEIYPFEYNSFAEFFEDWEDYEEPKSKIKNVWFNSVIADAHVVEIDYMTDKEAIKAVEKIKAWKRLKDKGFEFERVDKDTGYIKFAFFNREGKITKEMWQDIDLLFGGEE